MQEKAAKLNQIKIYNIFRKKENFSDEEAEIIASVLHDNDNTATKEDLAVLEGKIKVWGVILIVVMVLTNPKALELYQRIFTLISKF
jgi:hypothetical protein